MKLCEKCGDPFDCGIKKNQTTENQSPCWCQVLPLATNIPDQFKDCLCAKCLNEFIVTETDYYFDANGLMVFTEQYHLRRGSCCNNGCKHCPYQQK